MPSTKGFFDTLPAIVPPTIKKDDDKLHDRFRFLNLVWAFFTDRSFLAEYLYNNVVSFIVFLVI